MSGEPGSSSSSQVLPARSKQHHDFGVHLDERVHQSQHHFFVVRKGCDNTTFIQNFAGPWRDWSGRLLVIDEVSTCGAAAFEIVSRRMQQMARVLWRRHFATPPPEEMAPFGGIGVVLMGHFAQLPHPSRPACFRTCHGARGVVVAILYAPDPTTSVSANVVLGRTDGSTLAGSRTPTCTQGTYPWCILAAGSG